MRWTAEGRFQTGKRLTGRTGGGAARSINGPATGFAGQPGGAGIEPAPAGADDKPARNRHDQELRLEYRALGEPLTAPWRAGSCAFAPGAYVRKKPVRQVG